MSINETIRELIREIMDEHNLSERKARKVLAEALEKRGCHVRFSAVTRSPIALGHAIGSALSFRDSYGMGIPNFAYNVDPSAYDRILLCTETSVGCVDPAFVRALGPALTILSEADR